jgi:hypothetical protein
MPGILKTALPVLFALPLSACMVEESPHPYEWYFQAYGQTWRQVSDVDVAKGVVENAVLYDKSNHAAPNVGLLSVITSDNGVVGAGSCTSFLVSPDTIATNSHCVPEELRTPGSSCRERMWVHFVTDDPAVNETVECQEVLESSGTKKDTTDIDYAYLRLTRPVERKPFEISRAGFTKDMQVSVVKITPIETHLDGTLEIENCQVTKGTMIGLPGSDDPFWHLGTLRGCSIMHGNSGSPILDGDGRVRGIIQGSIDTKVYQADIETSDLKLLDGKVEPQHFATNFACVPDPTHPDGFTMPAECSRVEYQKPERKITPEAGHKVFSFGKVNKNEQYSYASPECIDGESSWPKSFRKPWYRGGGYVDSGDIKLQGRVWKTVLGVNSRLQLEQRTESLETASMMIKFSPKELSKSGRTRAEIEIVSEAGEHIRLDALDLPRCQ